MSDSPAPTDSTYALLRQLVKALDEKKAEDLRVLRVSDQSSITDYLILATGTSDPHLRALRVELEKILDAAGAKIAGMDTSEGSGWTVVDAYQIMIHVFTPDKRDAYRLEQLWADAEDIPVATVMADPNAPKPKPKPVKAAPAKKAPAKEKTPAKSKSPAKKLKFKAKSKPAPKAKAKAKAKGKAKPAKKQPAKKAPAKKAAAKKRR